MNPGPVPSPQPPVTPPTPLTHDPPGDKVQLSYGASGTATVLLLCVCGLLLLLLLLSASSFLACRVRLLSIKYSTVQYQGAG